MKVRVEVDGNVVGLFCFEKCARDWLINYYAIPFQSSVELPFNYNVVYRLTCQ